MTPWAKHPEKVEISVWGQWKKLDSQLLMNIMAISSLRGSEIGLQVSVAHVVFSLLTDLLLGFVQLLYSVSVAP